MKFIFPQNYNFKNKIFGFIDYSTALINIIWYSIIFFILKLLYLNLTFKISLFIIFCLPLFLLSLIGVNNENILYVFIYMYKFFKNRKIYFYYKSFDKNYNLW